MPGFTKTGFRLYSWEGIEWDGIQTQEEKYKDPRFCLQTLKKYYWHKCYQSQCILFRTVKNDKLF